MMMGEKGAAFMLLMPFSTRHFPFISRAACVCRDTSSFVSPIRLDFCQINSTYCCRMLITCDIVQATGTKRPIVSKARPNFS